MHKGGTSWKFLLNLNLTVADSFGCFAGGITHSFTWEALRAVYNNHEISPFEELLRKMKLCIKETMHQRKVR